MRGRGQASGGTRGRLIDTHSHLNHPRLLRRFDQVLARARAAGVADMLVVGYDLQSSQKAVELAQSRAGVWAAVGVHPHDAAGLGETHLSRLRRLAQSPKVVAIGETGLDFYRILSPREAQEAAFRKHLELAQEMGRPLIVHCREAQEAVLAALEGHGAGAVVWHCFDGTRQQAERALELGMMLGFGGRITHRSAQELRRVLAMVARDRILLETDCPYLTPEPLRGRDNEPANLRIIAESAAQARGEDLETVAAVTTENAKRVFGIGDETRGE